jgi:aryl-alcohol dehydrogenase-like predicted oxidoreductase
MLERVIEAEVLADLPALRHGRDPLGAARGGWLSGRWRKGREAPTSTRQDRLPQRYDLSIPANQRKLDAAEALAAARRGGRDTLIELAIAFVLRHPAVTAPIIGPRTMEHLEDYLPAADLRLDDAVLDRIDEIVPPGTNLNPADTGWTNPDLEPAARRRPWTCHHRAP